MKFFRDLHAADRWFSTPGPPVFSNNKTDRLDIAEILLKVALSTINLTLALDYYYLQYFIIE
jgi:hypothetical protein